MPGGPTSSTPRGMRAPSWLNFSGYFRNSTTSWSSVLASSTPATSWKVTTVLLPRNMRARLLPKRQRLVVGALRLAEHEEQQRADQDDGQEGAEQERQPRPLSDAARHRRGWAHAVHLADAEHAALMSFWTLVASSLGTRLVTVYWLAGCRIQRGLSSMVELLATLGDLARPGRRRRARGRSRDPL